VVSLIRSPFPLGQGLGVRLLRVNGNAARAVIFLCHRD
jgi:hypothetical protein